MSEDKAPMSAEKTIEWLIRGFNEAGINERTAYAIRDMEIKPGSIFTDGEEKYRKFTLRCRYGLADFEIYESVVFLEDPVVNRTSIQWFNDVLWTFAETVKRKRTEAFGMIIPKDKE